MNRKHYHHLVWKTTIFVFCTRWLLLFFVFWLLLGGVFLLLGGILLFLHPVSSHSCWMYVRAGRPAFARPYVGVHWSISLMSSSLLLRQCPACLVRLTWIVFVMGGRWPYSWCMNDREKWRERVRDIRASGTTRWWWFYFLLKMKRSLEWVSGLLSDTLWGP